MMIRCMLDSVKAHFTDRFTYLLTAFFPYLTPLPIRKIPLMNFHPLLSKLIERMPEVTHIRSLAEY
jgi:hypothetical protein